MADLSSLLGAAGIGGAIGKAIVSLELDTAKYNSELKAAEGQTVASTNAMGKSATGFGAISSTAMLGAGAAVVAFAAVSVKAAIEANDAHLKLQNTFANNATLADSSVEAFEAQADALRDLTGVDDEAIIGAQALLGQFKLTGSQVQQLIPLIVDLSEKMGIDLEAAAKAVGKATQGNAGILSRYGIVLDTTALSADAFGTTLKGLGVVQGFAAESAKAEPWRILAAQFEELEEQLGQALLPAIMAIIGALNDMITVVRFLTGDIETFNAKVKDATLSLVDMELHIAGWVEEHVKSIPIIGNVVEQVDHFRMALGDNTAALETQRGVIGDISDFYRAKFAAALDMAGKHVSGFARLTGDELTKWSTDVKKSFDSFVLVLDESVEATKITRREFINATDAMQREARQLSQAMREIANENWIPDKYVQFLSEQGPEWLIGFGKLTEDEQHKAVQAWRQSTDQTDMAKESLDRITGVLDKLDKGTSKHEVIIQYRYEGFDPSKPGMGGQQP